MVEISMMIVFFCSLTIFLINPNNTFPQHGISYLTWPKESIVFASLRFIDPATFNHHLIACIYSDIKPSQIDSMLEKHII